MTTNHEPLKADSRYGQTFHSITRIKVLCYRCVESGPAYDLPDFNSVQEAIEHLTASGWSRATDAEPADVPDGDQLWRCPCCTAERTCRLTGHDPITKPASTDYHGYRRSPHTECQRCGKRLTWPTKRPPAWPLRPWYRLRCGLAYARVQRAHRRATRHITPMF